MGVKSRIEDGKEVFWIDYRDAFGIRKREKMPLNEDKKYAEYMLRKRRNEAVKLKKTPELCPELTGKKKVLFKDFAETYRENHAKRKRSYESTDAHYLKRLIAAFGEYPLDEITPLMIERYRAERRRDKVKGKAGGKNISVAYVNRELSCLRTIFNKAHEWNDENRPYAVGDPFKKIKLGKENNIRDRFLEREEVDRLLKYCSPGLRAVILVAVHTGLRKSEIQNLKWRDINLQQGFIILYKTKTNERQTVPMNSICKEAFMTVRKHPESPYIFCGKNGKAYDFRKAFDTACGKAKLTNVQFHDLRRTFASHLVMSGVDLNCTRQLLRHKDIKTTVDRYAHLAAEYKSKAVETLAVKLGAPIAQEVQKEPKVSTKTAEMDSFWTDEERHPKEELSQPIAI